MSIVREQFDATLEVTVGTDKVMSLIIEDPEIGEPLPLNDTDVYNTATFRITRPDKTLIGTVLPVTYVNRPNGLVEFVVIGTNTTLPENAGNWLGTVQFINVNSKIIDQRKMNFNILA